MPDSIIQNVVLPVEGMTCSSCAGHVEMAVKQLPGVSNVVVNLETKTAQIQYNPTLADVVDMRFAVIDAGYTIPTQEIQVSVSGMHCVSCVAHIESALNDLPGVIEAEANLGLGLARVLYIPNVVTVSQIHRAIQNTGCKVIA